MIGRTVLCISLAVLAVAQAHGAVSLPKPSVVTPIVDREAVRQALLEADAGRINEQFLGVLGEFERKNKDVVLKDSLRCDSAGVEKPAYYQCGFQTSSGAVCKATRHSASSGKYRPYTVQCLDAKNQRRVSMFRRHV